MEYVRTPRQLETLCERLAKEPRLGIDTEFVGESRYYPLLEIIQIAAPDIEALVDYREISGGNASPDRLEPLWKLFASPAVELVFHAAKEDAKVLFFVMGRSIQNVFDTQVAMSFLDRRAQVGYINAVEELCGIHLDKGPQMVDWSRRPLSREMIDYALNDARWLLPLRQKLMDRLQATGRLAWFEQERDETSLEPEETDPREAWRRVKRGGVRGKALAALVELAAWREEEAMATDVPAQRVLPDDALVAIARQRPRRVSELARATRRLRPDQVRLYGDDIVAAVQRGLESDVAYEIAEVEGAPPPWVRGLASLLSSRAEGMADALDIALMRLVKSWELTDIAADPAGAPERNLPVLRGWRREVIGEDLLSLARGETALRWNPDERRMESVPAESLSRREPA
jgi:ribonuclease D